MKLVFVVFPHHTRLEERLIGSKPGKCSSHILECLQLGTVEGSNP